MEKLYRIVSMESFLSLLVTKNERYVRPIDCWEDTFEGYMLHLLDDNNGLLRVIERLYTDISNENSIVAIRNFSKLQRSRYTCYGSCWSKIEDSDAMWRIYSFEKKGIQLISSKKGIRDMLEKSGWTSSTFDIQDVKYDICNEEEAIAKILNKSAKVDSAYFHKRPAFEHEKEVRVLLKDTEKYKNIEAFSSEAIINNLKYTDKNKTVPERIVEAITKYGVEHNYRTVAPTSLSVPIKDLSSYIIGVRTHPQAADWYEKLIGEVCVSYGLNYLGKSDLYRKV